MRTAESESPANAERLAKSMPPISVPTSAAAQPRKTRRRRMPVAMLRDGRHNQRYAVDMDAATQRLGMVGWRHTAGVRCAIHGPPRRTISGSRSSSSRHYSRSWTRRRRGSAWSAGGTHGLAFEETYTAPPRRTISRLEVEQLEALQQIVDAATQRLGMVGWRHTRARVRCAIHGLGLRAPRSRLHALAQRPLAESRWWHRDIRLGSQVSI
jgi:hypothetical protein